MQKDEMDEFLDLVADYVEKITYSKDPGRELINFINDFSKLRGMDEILTYDFAKLTEDGELESISEEEYMELLELEREELDIFEDEEEYLELEDEVHLLKKRNDLLFHLLEEKTQQVVTLETVLEERLDE